MDYFSFNAGYAVKYGIEEAIMIENLSYWIEKNAANNRHFHDGRFWTYNTAEAFTKLFPFWSAPQIRRIMKSLEEKGVIIVGEFNDSSYDRTKWYAFADTFVQNTQLDLTKSSPRSNESERPIPDNYTGNYNPSPSQVISNDISCEGTPQRIEKTSNRLQVEESPIPPPPSPKKGFTDKDFVDGLIRAGVTEQTARDWVMQRKKAGAVSSQTSLNLVLNQFALLPGVSPEKMVLMAIEKSWRGFKAEWYNNAIKKENANNKPDSALYDRIHESGEGRNYYSTL